MTKNILRTTWFKKQLNTRAGARNAKIESCHNANLAAPGSIGDVAWQPAV